MSKANVDRVILIRSGLGGRSPRASPGRMRDKSRVAGQDNLLPLVLAGSWEIPNNLHSIIIISGVVNRSLRG